MASLANLGRRELTKATISNRSNLTTCQRTCQRTFFSTYFSSGDNSSSTAKPVSVGMFSKGDLIKNVAEEHELSQAQSARIVNGIFDTIVEVSDFIDIQIASYDLLLVRDN